MKVGILGTRGIPNAYGGFEQFAQYLALGLHQKGHEISVYNSSDHPYRETSWNGIQIIHRNDPEKRIGTAGQFIYDFNCLMDSRNRNFDILLQLGYTSNAVFFRLWPGQSINIVNMDGLEWKRSKYNKKTRQFLRLSEKWAVRHAQVLIADSLGIQDYLKNTYGKASIFIPYGATIFEKPNATFLNALRLEPGKYFLLIARMEPENNIEMIIQGYLQSKQEQPLVIVGNTENTFGQKLRKKFNQPNLLFTGAIFDETKLNNLRFFSTLYFHGHSVGGTNPSLLEAMACSCSIIAHNNPFNKAILVNEALYFSSQEEVSRSIQLLVEGGIQKQDLITKNLDKIRTQYNWPAVIAGYEKVFLSALSGRTKRS